MQKLLEQFTREQLEDLSGPYSEPDDIEQIRNLARIALAAMDGNSPAIPDGWMLVPVEPTAEMIAAAMICDDVEFNSDETFCVNFGNIYDAMLAAAPNQENS